MNPSPRPYERFEAVAKRMPQAPAIDMSDRIVTYEELLELVLGACDHLAAHELPPQSRIGLEASVELPTYVAYLSILRLGHSVVPLRPDNPASFQQAIAERARIACAVAGDGALKDTFTSLGIATVPPSQLLAPAAGRVRSVAPAPSDIAYILFTSGSTGRPKGVPIRNANLCAYLDHIAQWYSLGPGARLSHTFALTFDPSVFDMLGSWTTGATLVIPQKGELLRPSHYVNSRDITHWSSVPSLISFARKIDDLSSRSMESLRWAMFLGEPLPAHSALLWKAAAPFAVLENVYGPTELTVTCFSYRLPDEPASWPATENSTVPIGSANPGVDWILISEDHPASDEGELCVRGAQRFDGYLDASDNAGRFVRLVDGKVEHLTQAAPPAATDWYRTGDRVRRLDSGLLHLGRVDRQVKVRGYRIELGEVEGAIGQHPSVYDVAVVAAQDERGETIIRAFVCAAPGSEPVVKAHVKSMIPAYMIPAEWVWLPELPTNTSGKTDYLKLASLR